MILLNFAHPFTQEQLDSIKRLAGEMPRIISAPTQFDPNYPYMPQLDALMEKISLSSHEWQTEPILVNPPSLSAIAGLVLAELHGRMGYFPSILRISPVKNVTPPQFNVEEILDLKNVRDRAREKRK